MSEFTATVSWKRETEDFTYENYNRDHRWSFPGGQSLDASATADYFGNAACVNPEEALAASVSGCFMLTFLAIAAKKRFTVDSYADAPTAILGKDEHGTMAVTRLELRPKIAFSGERQPSPEDLEGLYEMAHKHCFISNTVKCDVVVLAS